MKRQTRAYAAGLCAVMAWSTVATAFKISLAHQSPALLVLYASAFSLLAQLGILAWQGRLGDYTTALRTHWKRSLCLGCINPSLYYLVLFHAYALLPAQEAQAINYTWALTMTLLAIPFLGQRLRGCDAIAAAVCYIGVLVIATHGALSAMHFQNPVGVGLALISTLLWAAYWLGNTKDSRDPVIGLALNFTLSLPVTFTWCALSGELQAVSWQGIAGAAYVGAFEMGFTFVLWLYAMKLTDSTAKIANLIFLSPVVSLFLIHQILGEPVLPSTGAGLSLILAGLILQKIPYKFSRIR